AASTASSSIAWASRRKSTRRSCPRLRKTPSWAWDLYPMRVAVTRYGPPTRMLGTLYAPPARVTARYCVPLGTCIATTVASASGVPSWAATTPLIAAVVTPCADSTAGTPSNANSTSTRPAWSNRLVGFTQSSLAAGDGRDSSTHAGPDTGQEVYKGAAELAQERERRKR